MRERLSSHFRCHLIKDSCLSLRCCSSAPTIRPPPLDAMREGAGPVVVMRAVAAAEEVEAVVSTSAAAAAAAAGRGLELEEAAQPCVDLSDRMREVAVEYCGHCGLPVEFCGFGPSKDQCRCDDGPACVYSTGERGRERDGSRSGSEEDARASGIGGTESGGRIPHILDLHISCIQWEQRSTHRPVPGAFKAALGRSTTQRKHSTTLRTTLQLLTIYRTLVCNILC